MYNIKNETVWEQVRVVLFSIIKKNFPLKKQPISHISFTILFVGSVSTLIYNVCPTDGPSPKDSIISRYSWYLTRQLLENWKFVPKIFFKKAT